MFRGKPRRDHPRAKKSTTMKTNIGLNDEARLEVGQILNLMLADETVLYATTRDYHWNITGPEFRSLHLQFEEQYTQLALWIDAIAERARAIGVGARGNWADLTSAARCSADPGIGLSAEHMLSELLALHEEMIVQLRTDSEACLARFKDAGTADFLTGLMERHEKAAWMLRAQLETEEQESAQGPAFEYHDAKS
jgi:starvation-inducible DNA-binding protein